MFRTGLIIGFSIFLQPLTLHAVQETQEEATNEFDHTISKDGLLLYYASTGREMPDIFIRDGNQERLNLTNRSDTWDIEPDFSPDGKKITYSSGLTMNMTSLRIMNVDGSKDKIFFDSDEGDAGADFSPDGESVVFYQYNYEAGTGSVMSVDKNGENLKNLTHDMSGKAHSPAWSWDGEKIYFSYQETKNSPGQIFVMDKDGSNKKQLTFGNKSKLGPVPSPDGQHVFYVIMDKGTDIYRMPSSGLSKEEIHTPFLITKNQNEYFVNVSHDGRYLLFAQGTLRSGHTLSKILID